MLALRDRSGAAPSFFCGCRAISTVAGAAPRRRDTSGARWRRYAGDRLAGRFPWSGWGARESLPGHPSHGRRIGPRHGPILSPSPSVVAPQEPAQLGMTQVLIRDNPGSSGMTPGCDSQILKRDILGLIRDSRIRLLFAYRRARRVRSRLPPPPPSPADARTPGSLKGGPEFFLWMPGDFDGRGRGAEKTRHVWSEVAPVCGRASRGPVSVVRVGRT